MALDGLDAVISEESILKGGIRGLTLGECGDASLGLVIDDDVLVLVLLGQSLV